MTVPLGLVVDASVAAKWHLTDESHTAEASRVLEAFDAGHTELSAPALIRYEVAQALERAVRSERMNGDEAATELRSFLRWDFPAMADGDDLIMAAQVLARETGASVYDALYVAHAEAIQYEVVTADEQLVRQMSDHAVPVHLLSELSLS